jgi:hypothetical protein
VRDSLADHWRESYVCKTRKSMKALGLAVTWKNSCCNISIILIDRVIHPVRPNAKPSEVVKKEDTPERRIA